MEGSPRKRVKVYELNDNSEWTDQGTGQCYCTYIEKSGLCITVKSEENGSTILESKILSSDVYQRQQETLIVWTESDGLDLALSFQEPAGCNEIWEQILDAQKRFSNDEGISLPKPEFGNLNQIEQAVHQLSSPIDRDKLINSLIQEDYYLKLLELFEMCEDIENSEGLISLFYIVKTMVLLNDRTILDPLLRDDNLLKVIGAFEYDPELPQKPSSRDYLTKESVLKQAIPLPDKDVEKRIQQTYRLQYFKNTILTRYAEEANLTGINHMIFYNYATIISKLQADESFLEDLFDLLSKKDVSEEKLRDGIEFIQEFCSVVKSVQDNKAPFYRTLSKHGMLGVLVGCLTSSDLKTRMACTDVMFLMLEFDPSLLRTYILGQEQQEEDEKKSLLGTLVQQLINDPDLGVKTHITEILRSLLDAENMATNNAPEKTEFISLFYEKYMPIFVEPLKTLPSEAQKGQLSFEGNKSPLYNYICELLCFFLHQHTYHIKSFILRNNIIAKVLCLLKAKEKYIVLSAIRFFRTVIGLKDDAYNGHIIQNKLFEPLFKVFESQKTKNNLVNSALLELFEFVRKENMKKLISHIVENYWNYMEGVAYVETFRLLGVKNEQNKELLTPSATPTLTSTSVAPANERWANRHKKEDDDDDIYFNDDDNSADLDNGAIEMNMHHHNSSNTINNSNSNNNSSHNATNTANNVSTLSTGANPPIFSILERRGVRDEEDDKDFIASHPIRNSNPSSKSKPLFNSIKIKSVLPTTSLVSYPDDDMEEEQASKKEDDKVRKDLPDNGTKDHENEHAKGKAGNIDIEKSKPEKENGNEEKERDIEKRTHETNEKEEEEERIADHVKKQKIGE